MSLRHASLLGIVLLLSSCVTAGGPMVGQHGREPTDEELVQDFLAVALRKGGNEGNAAERGYLMRFHDPIRVAVHGHPSIAEKQRIDAMMTQIRTITGHDVDYAAEGSAANYHVHLAGGNADAIARNILDRIPSLDGMHEKDGRWEALRKDVAKGMSWHQGQLCMGYYYQWKGRPDLESAHAVIARGMGLERMQRCLGEEMVQVLGLPGDTRKAWPSRFSDDQRYTDLSEYDWLYLRLLYDRDIRAGMTGAQARPVALRLVREWRSGNRRLAANPDPLPFDPAAYAPSNELLLEKFMVWALAKESGSHRTGISAASPRTTMIKWGGDIKVLFTGDVSLVEQRFDKVASLLAGAAGVSIQRANRPGEQNAHVQIGGQWDAITIKKNFLDAVRERLSEYLKDLGVQIILQDPILTLPRRGFKNIGFFSDEKERIYYYAAVRVLEPQAQHCPTDMLNMMIGGGLFPHLPWPSQNYFYSVCDTLSVYDLLFLRILYDPRIRPDMKEVEALPIARQILAELRPDETRPPEMARLIHPAWNAMRAQLDVRSQ